MKNILLVTIVVLSALFSGGCTDEETSYRVLADEGYTDIQLDGYSFFGCSEDDTYRTNFTATRETHNGIREVSGVVCCGLWKACTVRVN